MKFIQLNGYKILLAAVIALLFVSLTHYRTLSKAFAQQFGEREHDQASLHNTENGVTTSRRIKRFLISEGGGVVKLVLGTSFPIMMEDKKRSLSYFYNFQMQYAPPTKPLYWWSIFNTTTFAARARLRKRAVDNLMHKDKSHTLIYEFMETVLERFGNGDSGCMLMIICEVARAPFVDEEYTRIHSEDNKHVILGDSGRHIYHKLINRIFTPLRVGVDDRYRNARLAGENGVNCERTFGKCHIIKRWFKQFTKLI